MFAVAKGIFGHVMQHFDNSHLEKQAIAPQPHGNTHPIMRKFGTAPYCNRAQAQNGPNKQSCASFAQNPKITAEKIPELWDKNSHDCGK